MFSQFLPKIKKTVYSSFETVTMDVLFTPVWKMLDFTYGQEISITPIHRAHLQAASSWGVAEDTVMVAVLRPEIDPPIATSSVQLSRLKSLKEQRSAFPCVRSCKKVDCDHNVFVFDGMIVEEDATPMGLGLEDGDILGIIPRYNIRILGQVNEIVNRFGGLGLLNAIICETKRKQVTVGLNTVIGEQEGGLPLLKNKDPELQKQLVQAMHKFHWPIPQRLATSLKEEEEATALPPPGPTVYVGPVRNATPQNVLSSMPIVQFRGVSNLNSVDQLIDSWSHYTKDARRPTYLMYNNKRCDKKVGIKDFAMGLDRLYFSLPLSYNADDRDIDQLLGFIEGEDEKMKKGDKKKNRKKRTIAAEQSSAGEKPKAGLKEQTSTEAALGDDILESAQSSSNPTQLDDQKAQVSCPLLSDHANINMYGINPEGNKFQKLMLKKHKQESMKTKNVLQIPVEAELESTEINLRTTQLDDERAQLEEKETILQRSRDFLKQMVEVDGKRMAKLITDIEAAEDEKNGKLKEISAVEMVLSDLQTKHKILLQEVKEKDATMVKLVGEKRDLENDIEHNVLKTKKEIALLEEDMKSLKTSLPESQKEARGEPSKRVLQPNLQLLGFIDSKIEAKEEELECPVCFEVASPPIFACPDLHLICTDCRPKVAAISIGFRNIEHVIFQVSLCPECRELYPEKAKRHRFAEKAAEELAGLLEQRAQVLDTWI